MNCFCFSTAPHSYFVNCNLFQDDDDEQDAKTPSSGRSVARESSSSSAESRFDEFFDGGDKDVVLTPRGSHKPRQYLPASGKRYTRGLFLGTFLVVLVSTTPRTPRQCHRR